MRTLTHTMGLLALYIALAADTGCFAARRRAATPPTASQTSEREMQLRAMGYDVPTRPGDTVSPPSTGGYDRPLEREPRTDRYGGYTAPGSGTRRPTPATPAQPATSTAAAAAPGPNSTVTVEVSPSPASDLRPTGAAQTREAIALPPPEQDAYVPAPDIGFYAGIGFGFGHLPFSRGISVLGELGFERHVVQVGRGRLAVGGMVGMHASFDLDGFAYIFLQGQATAALSWNRLRAHLALGFAGGPRVCLSTDYDDDGGACGKDAGLSLEVGAQFLRRRFSPMVKFSAIIGDIYGTGPLYSLTAGIRF